MIFAITLSGWHPPMRVDPATINRQIALHDNDHIRLRPRAAATSREFTMAKPAPQFLFDVGSPNAYLSHEAIPAIKQRIGVKFQYVPILLGGIFKATNNKSPAETLAGVKNKR